MQVGKWGNSLAIRLPAVVVEALGLKDGDEIEIASARTFRVRHDDTRDEAIFVTGRLRWHAVAVPARPLLPPAQGHAARRGTAGLRRLDHRPETFPGRDATEPAADRGRCRR